MADARPAVLKARTGARPPGAGHAWPARVTSVVLLALLVIAVLDAVQRRLVVTANVAVRPTPGALRLRGAAER